MNLDPAAVLFASKKLPKEKPTTKGNQTPLPLDAGHHGRQRPEGERPARGSAGRKLKKSKSPLGQVATGASSDLN